MAIQTKTTYKTADAHQLLCTVLKEVRSLRREVSLALPHENLDEYAHPARIERSYRNALKKYPPRQTSR